ncbi:MAG: hypothetical protein Fur0010_08370 [Bdellovibrio sp.]
MQSQFRWNYIFLAYLALFSLGLIDNTRGAFYPEYLRDLGLTPSEGSQIFSVVALSGFVINFTTRYWLPRVGIVNAVVYSLFFMALGTLTVSVLPYFRDHLMLVLTLSSSLLGLGIGGSTISMNLLVAKGTPPVHLSRAFAGLHSTYGVSSLIAPLIFNLLFLRLGQWNLCYFALIPLPLILGIYFLLKKPEEIKDAPKKSLEAPIPFFMRIPFGLMLATYVMAEVLVSTRLVYLLNEHFKFSLESSNNYLALFFLGLAGGRLLFSFVKVPGSQLSHLITSHLLTFVAYFLGELHPGFYALCGFTMSWYFPTTMAWLQNKFHTGIEFMTASMLTTSGFLILGMHDLFGRIAEMTNLKSAFMMAPIASVISFFLLIYLEIQTRNRQTSG